MNLKFGLTVVLTLGAVSMARAHVRQRAFVESRQGEGQESLLHWSSSIRLSMHDFTAAGGTLGKSSTLSSTDVETLLQTSIAQWTGTLYGGLTSSLASLMNLNAGKPHLLTGPTADCEYISRNTGDDTNNILFTSQIDSSCGEELTDSGTVGVTRVRYFSSSGIIVEADIQFNDDTFRFTNTGSNTFGTTPPVVNLKTTATHELGHLFGMDHAPGRHSSMVYASGDGQDDTDTDDQMGIFSLYPPISNASSLSTLRGSVTTSSGAPVFGASVWALNARTLTVEATEMTDVNGAFEFCYVPPGPHISYANRFKPFEAGVLSDYFVGTGNGVTVSDTSGCFNPACSLMTLATTYSWDTATPSASGAADFRVFNLTAGTSHSSLSLAQRTTEITLTDVGATTGTARAITIDQPVLSRSSTSTLGAGNTTSLGYIDYYSFVVPASVTSMSVSTAAFKINSRIKLTLGLRNSVDGAVACTQTVANEATGTDARMVCDDLTPGATYYVRVLGDEGIAASLVPGNPVSVNQDLVTTNIPYYILSVYQTGASGASAVAEALSATSLAATRYQGMPTCGIYSGAVLDSTLDHSVAGKKSGCCGTLGSGGPNDPDAFRSFLLALLLSPILWLVLAREFYKRFRRR